MSAEQKIDLVKFKSSSPHYTDSDMVNDGAKKMIEQTAVVVSVDSGYAWILPQQKAGGCSACSSKTSCSSSTPFDFLRKEPQKMRVLNPLYARPGDSVVVGMQGNALVAYSLLAYVLPLLGLILVAMLGREIFAFMGVVNELGTVFSGIVGLLGGLRLANLIVSRSFKSSDFQPVILRVSGQPGFSGIMPVA
jgi:sigma-E factor negative regulatory protein RseC